MAFESQEKEWNLTEVCNVMEDYIPKVIIKTPAEIRADNLK
jgi:hypothetical protein